jgi:chromosome segregation ATPase
VNSLSANLCTSRNAETQLESQVKRLEAELSSATDNLVQLQEDFSGRRRSFDHALTTMRDEVRSSQDQYRHAEQRVAELSASLAAKDATLASMSSALMAAETSMANYENQLQQEQARCTALSAQNDSLVVQNNTLLTDLESVKQAMQAVQTNTDSMVSSLEDQKHGLQLRLEQAIQNERGQADDITRLMNELEQLKSGFHAMEAESQEAIRSKIAAQDQLDSLSHQLTVANEQMVSLNAQLETTKEELTMTKQKTKKLSEQYTAVLEESKSLTSQLLEQSTLASELQTKIHVSQSECNAIKSELATTREQKQHVQNDLEAQLGKEKETVLRLDNELASIKAEAETYKNENKTLEDRVAQTLKASESLSAQLLEKSKSVESKVQELTVERESLVQEHARLVTSLQLELTEAHNMVKKEKEAQEAAENESKSEMMALKSQLQLIEGQEENLERAFNELKEEKSLTTDDTTKLQLALVSAEKQNQQVSAELATAVAKLEEQANEVEKLRGEVKNADERANRISNQWMQKMKELNASNKQRISELEAQVNNTLQSEE